MSGYIGNIPTPQATQTRDTFTATSGQTSFATSGYTPGFLDVFLNGVHLVNGTDYTASNGSDVVLTSGATTGDNLEVVSYSTFEVFGQTFTGNSTFTGNLTVDTNTLFVDAANNRVGVGTTDANPAAVSNSVGVSALAVGKIEASRDGNAAASFNRKTSDGNIVDFRKDGTTVGSIGNRSGSSSECYIALTTVGTGAGLMGGGNGDALIPSTDSGAISDATINLGGGTARFKNLYLSGGVYLGGTGSANLLDDYEEGTWTPTFSVGGISGSNIVYSGAYTKVGRLVTVYFIANSNSASNNVVISSYAGFSGLPFVVSDEGTGSVTTEDIDAYSRNGFCQVSSSTIFLSASGASPGTNTIYASVTYTTTA
jgi:hypothetical protein